MPGTGSPDALYIHSKMCMVNFDPASGKGGVAYVGSVNDSGNSFQKAREMGVIFKNDPGGQMIWTSFRSDWDKAVSPDQAANCPPPQAGASCPPGAGSAAPPSSPKTSR
jgi:hypothetical protein